MFYAHYMISKQLQFDVPLDQRTLCSVMVLINSYTLSDFKERSVKRTYVTQATYKYMHSTLSV